MVNPAQLGKSSVGLEEQMPHQQISTKVVEMAIAQLKELHLSEYEGRVKEHVSPIRCVKGLGVLQAAELLQAHHLERVFGSKVPDDCAIALKTLKASGFYTSAELASFEHENKIDLKDPAGGQGMNTGIQDAFSLAHALYETIQSKEDTPLKSWEKQRLHVAQKVIQLTDKMTRLGTLSSPTAKFLRNQLLHCAGKIPWITRALAQRLAGD